MAKLEPRCLAGKGHAYSATGYLIPCCWTDPYEIGDGVYEEAAQEIVDIFFKEELKLAEKHFGIEIYRPRSIDMFNELDSVAALISQLDFVVGPLTSILSMAGALGTRCFGLTLTKDWTGLGTDSFLWNPTMTCLYKETSTSWKPLMDKVADMIGES